MVGVLSAFRPCDARKLTTPHHNCGYNTRQARHELLTSAEEAEHVKIPEILTMRVEDMDDVQVRLVICLDRTLTPSGTTYARSLAFTVALPARACCVRGCRVCRSSLQCASCLCRATEQRQKRARGALTKSGGCAGGALGLVAGGVP